MLELFFILYFVIGVSVVIICDYYGWAEFIMGEGPFFIILMWPICVLVVGIFWFEDYLEKIGAYLFRK